MSERELTRRSLLVIGGGALCAHAIGCGMGLDTQLPATVPAGTASSVSVGSLRALLSPVAIGRDASGIYAMTLICTHQGCDMSGGVFGSDVSCGCHGSVFDAQGNVLRGPASRSLEHFAVTADASGQLTVLTDQVVSASTRLVI
jgi:Rieske Fe-S protein